MSTETNMENTLLETIQNQVAKDNHCSNWAHVQCKPNLEFYDRMWALVCERYALEVAKASLQRVAENDFLSVYKDIICNPSNIVIK